MRNSGLVKIIGRAVGGLLVLACCGPLGGGRAAGQTATLTKIAPNVPEPNAGVMQASDGNYYSTTPHEVAITVPCASGNDACTYLYKITPDGTVTVFHTFDVGGSSLEGGSPSALVEGVDGALYGANAIGGANNHGTIFRITTAGALTVLNSFPNNASGYNANGVTPGALAVGNDGNFYGVTQYGGDGVVGGPTFFSITPSGVFTMIHRFVQADGVSPYITNKDFALVQALDGNFYGGGQGCVDQACSKNTTVLYSITPSGVVTVLNKFPLETGSSGQQLLHAVTGPFGVGQDGAFYGVSPSTSSSGGTAASTFRFTSSGNFQTLTSFSASAGGLLPDQHLLLASDGNFYGTTLEGGDTADCPQSTGCGTFFQLQPAGALTTVYTFNGQDGGGPQGPTVQIGDGSFVSVNNGASTTGGPTAGIAYDLALSPALPAPIQITFSPKTVPANTPTKLTWSVLNAFSASMQQCHASIAGTPPGAGSWSGSQVGSLNGLVYTGNTTITPTMDGTYTYVLNCGGVETGTGTLVVGNVLTVATTALPVAMVGKAYGQPIMVTGGTAPYSFVLQGGTLPMGLSLDAVSGLVSGTPTQFGSVSLMVQVTDSASTPNVATGTVTLAVKSGLAVATTALNKGVVGTPYMQTLSATGGTGPYLWSVVQGSLPAGLMLASTTGVIYGMPTAVSSTSVGFQVMDAEMTPDKAQAGLTLNVTPAMLVITTGSLPAGQVGVNYLQTLAATGGTTPYAWTVIGGALPKGLTLAGNTGIITGKPTQFGTTSVTVQLADASNPQMMVSAAYTIAVSSGLAVTTAAVPNGAVGAPYSTTLAATGGTAAYKWSVLSGMLPAGLTLDATSGVLAGNPTAAGSAMVTVQVLDSEGMPAAATALLTVTVIAAPLLASSTALTSSAATTVVGASVTLTATVQGAGGAPNGMVTFYNGTAVLGMGTVAPATGIATLTTSFATAGVYSLTAAYSGNGTFSGSTSGAVTETVVTVGISAAVTPGTLTIVSGNSGTLFLTLTPTGGYTGTVTFSCGALPAHASCTFAPTSLNFVAGSGAMTDTLTIGTTAATTGMLRLPGSALGGVAFAGLLIGLPGLALWRGRRKTLRAGVFGVIGMLVLTMSGCSSNTFATASTQTAAGTYTIPITLTLNGGVTQSVAATVVVQ